MNILFHEVVGTLGSTIIIVTYFLLQIRKMRVDQVQYSILNAMGAGFILYSLSIEFNFSAFIIELFWLGISLFGIFQNYQSKKKML